MFAKLQCHCSVQHWETKEDLLEIHLWKTQSSFVGTAVKQKEASSHCQIGIEIRGIDYTELIYTYIHMHIRIYTRIYRFLIQNWSF